MTKKMPMDMEMVEEMRVLARKYGYVLDDNESWYCMDDGRVELLFRKAVRE
jgi:hypothetical protein